MTDMNKFKGIFQALLTPFNEKDENENITVYVSNVDRSSGDPKLMGVDDEEEWNRVKDVLRELSKSE